MGRQIVALWTVLSLGIAQYAWTDESADKQATQKDGGLTIGVAISAAALANTILTNISNALTDQTRVDAQGQSAGPDDDDIGFSADNDETSTPLETDLAATNNFRLGPNGSTFEDLHAGSATLHVTSPLTTTSWTVVPGGRHAWAVAVPDTTPEQGSDNRTAAAAVGTFAFLGTVVQGFTIQASDSRKGPEFEIGLGLNTQNTSATSSAAVLWSLDQFLLQDDESGNVTIFPPYLFVDLFHNFAQLSTSPKFRPSFAMNTLVPGLGADLLTARFADADANADAHLGTTMLGKDDIVDFTLTGARLSMQLSTVPRAGRSDREVVEDYLQSNFVRLDPPPNAEFTYTLNVTRFEPLGGFFDFPEGSVYAQDGGFGESSEPGKGGTVDIASMVGLYIEVQGNILDALNRSHASGTGPLFDITGELGVGANFDLSLTYSSSDVVSVANESVIRVGCARTGSGISLSTPYTLIGGETFAEEASTNSWDLRIGGFGFNSNQRIVYQYVECPTDLGGTSSEVLPLTSDAITSLFGDGSKQTAAFPCAAGPNGFTVCPVNEGDQPEGDWLVVSSILADDVPLSDPLNSYQYGFVFDRDNDTTNNYQASAQFANDYYQDTDLWYSVEYSPSQGWALFVTDARSTKGIEPVASGARAIIAGNAIILMVPAAEFDVPDPGFRQTAFRHSGDFGQNEPFDYSSDISPAIDVPLRKAADLLTIPGGGGCAANSGDANPNSDLIVLALAAGAILCASHRRRYGRRSSVAE